MGKTAFEQSALADLRDRKLAEREALDGKVIASLDLYGASTIDDVAQRVRARHAIAASSLTRLERFGRLRKIRRIDPARGRQLVHYELATAPPLKLVHSVLDTREQTASRVAARAAQVERVYAYVVREGCCSAPQAARGVGRSSQFARTVLGELVDAGRLRTRLIGLVTHYEKLPALASSVPAPQSPPEGTALRARGGSACR